MTVRMLEPVQPMFVSNFCVPSVSRSSDKLYSKVLRLKTGSCCQLSASIDTPIIEFDYSSNFVCIVRIELNDMSSDSSSS